MRAWIFSPRGVFSIGALSLLISALLLAIFIPRERAAQGAGAFERERARVRRRREAGDAGAAQAARSAGRAAFSLQHAGQRREPRSTPIRRRRSGCCERLIALLRGAAAAAGDADATLAAQIEHLRAYLDLMALRMGPRLAFRLDVAAPSSPPSACRRCCCSRWSRTRSSTDSSRRSRAARSTVTARRDGGMLVLAVADTGVGFPATAEVRRPRVRVSGSRTCASGSRRSTATRRTLTIEDNAPSGTRVTIRLPLAGWRVSRRMDAMRATRAIIADDEPNLARYLASGWPRCGRSSRSSASRRTAPRRRH